MLLSVPAGTEPAQGLFQRNLHQCNHIKNDPNNKAPFLQPDKLFKVLEILSIPYHYFKCGLILSYKLSLRSHRGANPLTSYF